MRSAHGAEPQIYQPEGTFPNRCLHARRHGYRHSPLQRREPGHPRSSLRRNHRSRCTEEPLHEAV